MILLTGAAGFIGTAVLARLRAAGRDVAAIDAFLPQVHGTYCGREGVLTSRVGNVAELVTCSPKAFADVDTIVHLAAEVGVGQSQYEPYRYVGANVAETVALLDAFTVKRKQVRRIVVASSMSVYGEGAYDGVPPFVGRIERVIERGWDAFDLVWPDGQRSELTDPPRPILTTESKTPDPQSVYALSKYDTERYALLLGATYGVPTVALRFFNVVGPGQALGNPYTGVLAGFACRVLNGDPPLVFEDGRQSRDFVYLDDVVRAVCDATDSETVGAWNVCTGRATSVGDLAETWCRLVRDDGGPMITPVVTGDYRKGDVRHCVGSPEAARKVLGFEARIELEDGLRWLMAALKMNTSATWAVHADRSEQAQREAREAGVLLCQGGGGDPQPTRVQ